jgi:hypothetical protein
VEQARTPKRWTTRIPEGVEYRPIAGRFEGPERFGVTYEFDDPPGAAGLSELSLAMELAGDHYVITRVEAVAPAGGRVDIEALRRFNYSTALRHTVRHVVKVPMSTGDQIAFQLGQEKTGPLHRAAYVYTLARLVGEHPTKAVADAMGITTAAAAQRVRRARQKGYLPPASRERNT